MKEKLLLMTMERIRQICDTISQSRKKLDSWQDPPLEPMEKSNVGLSIEKSLREIKDWTDAIDESFASEE